MDTLKMPINFQTQPRRRARNQCRPQAQSANPLSHPLNQHPQWMNFIQDLTATILDRYPDLRPPFHELLDRADLL